MADIIVTVDADHVAAIDEVVKAARASGMRVDQVLAAIGVISGSVDDARVATLEALPGVDSVERSQTFQLPPPDASVQ